MCSDLFYLLLLARTALSSKGVATPGPRDRLSFFSRPDLKAPTCDLEVLQPEHVSPGFDFCSPWQKSYIKNGPYIYDSAGQLVWSGVNSVGGGNTHGIHVCDYLGRPHLCFYQGNQVKGSGSDHGLVFDEHYMLVKEIKTRGGRSGSDLHDFHLIDGGKKALITIFEPVPVHLTASDTTAFNRSQIGWVREAGFQEMEPRNGQVTFSWRSLNHIPLLESETRLTPDRGMNQDHPWDYLHLNSVDKFANGDYLISGRHTSTIYKVSGRTGETVWRVGGKHSDYQHDFPMSRQHHARVVFGSEQYTDISLFDNGRGKTAEEPGPSFGAILRLNHSSKSVSLLQVHIREMQCDSSECRSEHQGSLEILPETQNVLVGWGEQACISEDRRDTGEVVLRAKIASNHVANYRASKRPWTGKPLDQPAIWSYSLSELSSTMVYVSWNGDTEVAVWRVYGGNNSEDTSLQGSANRLGFETLITCSASLQYAFAEGLDAHGKMLSRSPVRRTFTPGPGLSKSWDEQGCPMSMDWPNIENEITMPWLAFVNKDSEAKRSRAPTQSWKPKSLLHSIHCALN